VVVQLSGTIPTVDGRIIQKEIVFHQFAEDMSDEDVNLLNAGRAGGWDNEGDLGDLYQGAAIVSGQGDCLHPHLFGHFECFDDIGRGPAGADADGDIPFFAEGLELFSKDLAKREVIRNAGEDRGVGGQSDRRKGGAIHNIAVDKFCGEMLGVSRASSISEEEEFIARLETMGDQLDHIEEPGEVLLQKTVFDLGAFLESLLDDIFHGVKILYFPPLPVKDGFYYERITRMITNHTEQYRFI